jgi:deoxyribodipyrimidine photo-lyase
LSDTLFPTLEPILGPATRTAGLERVRAFTPMMGGKYAAGRNADPGRGQRTAVSMLSPFIRRRLITEEEAIAAALSRYALSSAEKFVQEVCWRTYWKGWLQMRPGVWREYRGALARLRGDIRPGGRTWKDLSAAVEGRTGIECFDAWASELEETGWLHNHTRMWVASIWIFTLGLPWQLGAAWFADRLIDFDPASNTLSWRWVAGLHTQGKHYLARAENIRTNTGGRFNPRGQLDERASPLPPDSVPRAAPLSRADQIPGGKLALLITEEDMTPEQWGLEPGRIAAAAVLSPFAHRAPAAGASGRWSREAAEDASHRATAWLAQPVPIVDDPAAWAKGLSVAAVVTGETPVGYVDDYLLAQTPGFGSMPLKRLRRRWDDTAWPHATKGFFAFKEKIPSLVRHLGGHQG